MSYDRFSGSANGLVWARDRQLIPKHRPILSCNRIASRRLVRSRLQFVCSIRMNRICATDKFLPPLERGDPVNCLCRGLAECERKRLHTGIEKLDLELSIPDGFRLADQLIQPRFGTHAVALLVNVNSVNSARRLSIEEHAKSHRLVPNRGLHDEMQIAGVKAVHDPAADGVEHNGLLAHRPITREGPMIEPQSRGPNIDVTLVRYCAIPRNEILGALIADIGLRGPQTIQIRRRFHTTGIN